MALASQVLARAAERLDRPGAWCQGRPRAGGAICAVIAIADATPVDLNWAAMMDVVHRAIGDVSLTEFNDEPGRTQDEVVAALRAASELARSEGR